jgi:hypothetical protein
MVDQSVTCGGFKLNRREAYEKYLAASIAWTCAIGSLLSKK